MDQVTTILTPAVGADGVDAQLLPVEIFFDVKQNSGIDRSSDGSSSAKASLKAKSSILGLFTSAGK